MTAVEVAVDRGRGWEPGQLRTRLQALVDRYAGIPKEPAFTYEGGPIGAPLFICLAVHMPTSHALSLPAPRMPCTARLHLQGIAMWGGQPCTTARHAWCGSAPCRPSRRRAQGMAGGLARGPPCCCGGAGEGAARILEAWQQQAPVLPPENWRPPPPAGYLAAQGMRRAEDEPWRPVRASCQLQSCCPSLLGFMV